MDGTSSFSEQCSGACSQHGGVAFWLRDVCGDGGTPEDPYENVAGRWVGTWTWTPMIGQTRPVQDLSFDLNVGSDGAITGTVTEAVTGRTSAVAGTYYSTIRYGHVSTDMRLNFQFGATDAQRRIEALRTQTIQHINAGSTYLYGTSYTSGNLNVGRS